jgi:hypothetical protein
MWVGKNTSLYLQSQSKRIRARPQISRATVLPESVHDPASYEYLPVARPLAH